VSVAYIAALMKTAEQSGNQGRP